MGYEINAWLEDGEPRLQILDADSKTVRMAWRAGATAPGAALHGLFRDLMLLSVIRPAMLPPNQTPGQTPSQTSRLPTSRAFFSMNSRRGSTSSPMSVVKTSSAE